MGKARYLWVTGLPWIFLVVMIFWADFLNIFEIYLPKGEWTMFTVSIIMAVLVIIVAIGAIRRCIYLAKTVPASYDTTETVEAEELKHLQELVRRIKPLAFPGINQLLITKSESKKRLVAHSGKPFFCRGDHVGRPPRDMGDSPFSRRGHEHYKLFHSSLSLS